MKKIFSNKWFHTGILFLFLCGAAFYSGSSNDLRKRLQYFVFDGYNKFKQRPASDEIVIIDLDENSLRLIGQWPWSRDIMADLIKNLKDYGAKVIAFDMVFAEEDRTSPQNIAKKLPETTEYQDARDVLNNLSDNDVIFSDQIAENGNVVTAFISAKEAETRHVPALPVAPTIMLSDKKTLVENVFSQKGVATNLPKFSQKAAGNGHFMVEPEMDGIIRRVPLFVRYKPERFQKGSDILYPALSLEALRVSIDPNVRMVLREKKNRDAFDLRYQLTVGDYDVPVDDRARLWVYYRDIKPEEYVSAHRVLKPQDENALKEKINNKIVFIGTSAEGLRDIRSTTLEPFVAGVEVHVNVVEQIIQGNFLKRPEFIDGAEAILVFIAGLSIILLASFLHLAWLGLVTIALITSMFAGSLYAFLLHGLLLDPVYPALVLFLLFVCSSLLSYFRSEAGRKHVKAAFGHYISPEFLEELTKSPEKLKLGGDLRELTVMFTDIRSFTKISESLPPEELIQLMNDFLTPMSNLVMENRGTIDKYMGDAMMAFWNAPLDDNNHARNACLTALKMNDALKPINESLKEQAEKEGKEPVVLNAGIGINTGMCSVGNMGSKQRFAYSAMGDNVNLASRLEGQTKSYGVEILVGEATYKKASDLAFLELDLIKVYGREEPVKIYTIVGDHEVKKSSDFKRWEVAHNSMLAAYRIADFSCAAQDCKEAMEFSNGQLDGYYKVFKKRITAYTKTPPKDDWDGVYVARGK